MGLSASADILGNGQKAMLPVDFMTLVSDRTAETSVTSLSNYFGRLARD